MSSCVRTNTLGSVAVAEAMGGKNPISVALDSCAGTSMFDTRSFPADLMSETSRMPEGLTVCGVGGVPVELEPPKLCSFSVPGSDNLHAVVAHPSKGRLLGGAALLIGKNDLHRIRADVNYHMGAEVGSPLRLQDGAPAISPAPPQGPIEGPA